MDIKQERSIWLKTTIAALIFLIFYGVMQKILADIESVSLLIGTIAFWIVLFIIQRTMVKDLG